MGIPVIWTCPNRLLSESWYGRDLSTQYSDDEPGYVPEAMIDDGQLLPSRIDALMVEMGMRKLLINKAEEMSIEQEF